MCTVKVPSCMYMLGGRIRFWTNCLFSLTYFFKTKTAVLPNWHCHISARLQLLCKLHQPRHRTFPSRTCLHHQKCGSFLYQRRFESPTCVDWRKRRFEVGLAATIGKFSFSWWTNATVPPLPLVYPRQITACAEHCSWACQIPKTNVLVPKTNVLDFEIHCR